MRFESGRGSTIDMVAQRASTSSLGMRCARIKVGRKKAKALRGSWATSLNVVLKSKQVEPEGIEEVRLWVDDNVEGGPVVNIKGGAGGSGWASTHVLELKQGRKLFAKMARGNDDKMFQGEFRGLRAMEASNSISIPHALGAGLLLGPTRGSYIVMDYIEMSGSVNQEDLGHQLALMHLAEPLEQEAKDGLFGFPVENTIGATPQPNDWLDDWVSFLRDQRLWYQLNLTRDTKLLKMGEKVMDRLGTIFEGIEVKPSILHGDLWSGNIAATREGKPIIFDPACYYGHHEADFGMSWCASFSGSFWGAYHNMIPRESGFAERQELYKLYHYLNHLNLFGGSYYYSCESILRKFS